MPTSEPGRSKAAAWLACVIVIAAGFRVATYGDHWTNFSPDTFSYLNAARALRGEEIPRAWDHSANLPRDDEGARPFVFPAFLNLVFALDRHGSPKPVLTSIREAGADDWHMTFLRTEENLAAARIAQHMLGVFSTALLFLIVWGWTKSGWLSATAAVTGVGLRPAWAWIYEPWILSEVLTATLILCLLLLLQRLSPKSRWGRHQEIAFGVIAGAVVLARPATLFLVLFLMLALVWYRRAAWASTTLRVFLPCLLLLTGWSARNRMAHGFWGISTTLGVNIVSHFRSHPDVFNDERIRARAEQFRDQRYIGIWIARSLYIEDGVSFRTASGRLTQQTLRAIRLRPLAYLRSVGSGIVEYLAPTELFANRSSLDGFLLWFSVVVYSAVTAAALSALFARSLPWAARIAALAFVFSAITTPLLTADDNGARYSFPVEQLTVLAAAALVHAQLMRRRSRAGQSTEAIPAGVAL
jgi:hypothetical protein